MDSVDRALAAAVNRVSAENGSNTADFILGEFLGSVLAAFDTACNARDLWYGVRLEPGVGAARQLPPAQVFAMVVHEPRDDMYSHLSVFSDFDAAVAAAHKWAGARLPEGAQVVEHPADERYPLTLTYSTTLDSDCVIRVQEAIVDAAVPSP